jgi:hypothetical protein
VFHTHVASACSKYFICFQTYVAFKCFSCCKCFMLFGRGRARGRWTGCCRLGRTEGVGKSPAWRVRERGGSGEGPTSLGMGGVHSWDGAKVDRGELHGRPVWTLATPNGNCCHAHAIAKGAQLGWSKHQTPFGRSCVHTQMALSLGCEGRHQPD